MLSFFAAGFAVAALIAATGPILIHLFNRRRYRTVDWAAMDFLREALRRNRKVLQIRDLLILALRVLCVLCFGFALARPFLTSGNASAWPLFAAGTAIVVALGAAVTGIAAKEKRARLIAGSVCGVASLVGAWGAYRLVQTDAGSAAAVTDRSPVHAVLLVDNSQSMGYESLNGTLLDQSKAKALDFVDRLPPESRISVIPLCGGSSGFTLDAYRNREDAIDALRRIEVVDLGAAAASASRAIELAAQACEKVPELDAKRVVLLGDQQAVNWPAGGLEQALKLIPELQIVHIAPDGPAENLAVTEFRIRDGIADVETPASFLATISYEGRDALSNVLVTLTVDGAVVASQTVEMQPGQASREIEFKHQFDVNVDPGQPAFVPATVSVESDSSSGDRLPQDNRRHLSVPVVAGIPIVFVDQFGAQDEDAEKNRLGDTYALRRWLAPRMSRDDVRKQLIRIRHTTIDKLEQSHLEDARLAVVAGVPGPGDKTPLLRQFVQQGGRLVIAAGGQFDPAAWTDQAWLDGAGILPSPLKPLPVGETPEEAPRKPMDPFFLAFPSLQHDYFLIEGESRGFLEDFYKGLFFVKAIEADTSPEVLQKLSAAETARIESDRAFLDESAKRTEQWAEMEKNGTFGATEQGERAADDERRRTIAPQWLLWTRERHSDPSSLPPATLAERTRPRALGQFPKGNAPFLVEREIGDGRVLFVATSIFSRGALSDWNNLTKDNPVLLFDRIIRTQLEETLPRRNFDSGERITLPAERGEQMQYTLTRPEVKEAASPDESAADDSDAQSPDLANVPKREEILPVDALGAETFGISVRNATRAGHYVVTARRLVDESAGPTIPVSLTPDAPPLERSGEKRREMVLAVNGPASESDLRSLDAAMLKERLGDANYRWIESDEPIALEGAQVRGRDLWKWLAGICLAGLLLEMFVLSWPAWRSVPAPVAEARR